MKRKRFAPPLTRSFAAVVLAGIAQVGLAQSEYSADLVQTGVDGKATTGKIYVGKQGTRTEMSQAGQQIVTIVNFPQEKRWLIYPAEQSYMELRGPAAPGTQTARPAGANPCAGAKGMTCTKVGSEAVHGRSATKWQMAASQEGKAVQAYVWIDDERGVPLRHELPDDRVMEMRILGTESLAGRAVEKWEIVTRAGGQSQTSYQWYDPALEQSVRQEFPGGFVSELKNIQVGSQPAKLFEVPAGYKKVESPTPTPAGG